VSIEAPADEEQAASKIEEVKSALRELRLNENIDG
jgi:hypothetical protein